MARVRDAWYVAARSAELGPAPIARTILDTPLVLVRDAAGAASALLDRCAHRNVPLSQGWCSAGHLVCAYHGWEYQGDGAVTRVPALSGDQSGKARRAPCFPVREQQGLIWVWLSPDAAPSAEPYQLPHLGEARGYRRAPTARRGCGGRDGHPGAGPFLHTGGRIPARSGEEPMCGWNVKRSV